MTNLRDALNPIEPIDSKKKFYISEIMMLKSIIALLVLTFLLLNEMQASNKEVRHLKAKPRTLENNPNEFLVGATNRL